MGAFSLESIGLRVRTTALCRQYKKGLLRSTTQHAKAQYTAHARKSKPFKFTSINKDRCAAKSPNPKECTQLQFFPILSMQPETPTSVVHPSQLQNTNAVAYANKIPESNTPVYQKVQAKTLVVRDTALISFPFNGFTHCLTLFSKFFASFPHGTCTLSVSCQYLALDEVYHPLNAALSSSATL
jgi:hypothetical protein